MTHHVLIVDDERNIAVSLKFLMEQAGFAVRIASDGQEALDMVAESPPDLILLDVNLPKMSGYHVCEAIRGNPGWQHTRIIMLTAKGRDIEREKGIAMGADDYVTKPFATEDVVLKVREALGIASS